VKPAARAGVLADVVAVPGGGRPAAAVAQGAGSAARAGVLRGHRQ
jgi:hypothetical protein